MILTGPKIAGEVERDRIVISPFDKRQIEPNSYGFRLGRRLVSYEEEELDAHRAPSPCHEDIPDEGKLLLPGRFYLGRTKERMGSEHYAATIYARRSVSTLGMWIQFSAPLGHAGAIIPWTLEIRVAAPLIVYPEILIGKIAFWVPYGEVLAYQGRYAGSTTTVPSRLVEDPADLEVGV